MLQSSNLSVKARMNIRAVERAMQILQELNLRPVSTIAHLHNVTGLPKPTLVRMLQTLNRLGFVENDTRLGGYQVTAQVASLSSGFHKAPHVVEAGRAWAIALTRQHQWPVAIALYDEDAMIVRFSTVPDSNVSPFHATINMRLPLLTRGLGLAYLAFVDPDQLDIILNILSNSKNSEDIIALNKLNVYEVLERVRKNGYATRSLHVDPKNSDTIAVPIFGPNGRVCASIGLTYFRSAFKSRADAIDKYAEFLKKASYDITRDLARLEVA